MPVTARSRAELPSLCRRGGKGRLGLLLAVGLALQTGAGAASPTHKLPWAQRLTGYLTTTDGVSLQYSVLLPKSSGRFPVVINYGDYDPGVMGGLAYPLRAAMGDADSKWSAALEVRNAGNKLYYLVKTPTLNGDGTLFNVAGTAGMPRTEFFTLSRKF